MRSFASVAEDWVQRDGSAGLSPGQGDEVRAFSWWLSNRFQSPDAISDVAQAWDEFSRDPSEWMYSVWHMPPYSMMHRTDPLPTRTLAAAQHRAEEYLAAGEWAGVDALHATSAASPAVVEPVRTRPASGSALHIERSGRDSVERMIDPTGRVARRRSLLAAGGIVVVAILTGIVNLLTASVIVRLIDLHLH